MSKTLPSPYEGLIMRRKLKLISAKEIAKRLGMQPNSYYRIERGERRMYVDQAIVIAKMLECTVDDLMTPVTAANFKPSTSGSVVPSTRTLEFKVKGAPSKMHIHSDVVPGPEKLLTTLMSIADLNPGQHMRLMHKKGDRDVPMGEYLPGYNAVIIRLPDRKPLKVASVNP